MNRTRGSALLELVVAAGIAGVMMLAVARSIRSAQQSATLTTQHQLLEARMERALQQLRDGLKFAGLSTLRAVPQGGGADVPLTDGVSYDNLSFAPVTDASEAGPQYGPEQTWSLRLKPGENLDGVDNDSNGIADERLLVHTTPIATTVALSEVTGFTVLRNGTALSIRVAAATPTGEAVIEKSATLEVRLLND